MDQPGVRPPLLKRDRAVALGGLVAVTALAWVYIWRLAAGMGDMDAGMGMAMPRLGAWGPMDLLLLFIMWTVMMVAMMLPSAAPMILLFAATGRRRRERANPAVPTAVFVSGYLTVWAGFSALAALAQWGLQEAALLSPRMASATPLLGGVLLIIAGAYQWTPLKRSCLARCRSPLGFLSTSWREGTGGAFRMGVEHGTYCLGCCWLLMGLLFVAGVMNLLWVWAIAAFVLVEKVVPGGVWVGRIAGVLLAGWGVWLLTGTPGA